MKKRFPALALLSGALFFSHANSKGEFDRYPEAFVGNNGWVVTRWEVETGIESRDVANGEFRKRLAYLKKISDALEKSGTKVIVALVPSRVNVYPDMLPKDIRVEYYKTPLSYNVILDEIKKSGIRTTNLLSAIRDSEYYSSKAKTYFCCEVHWNAYGSSTAAAALAKLVKQSVGPGALPQAEYKFTLLPPVPRGGQSYRDKLPEASKAAAPKMVDVPYKAEAVNKDSGSGLLSGASPKVVLVGTSFSGYGFYDSLRASLGADVLNMALSGKGMWTPMAEYLTSPDFKKSRPSVIIWEMPEHILATYPSPDKEERQIFDRLAEH